MAVRRFRQPSISRPPGRRVMRAGHQRVASGGGGCGSGSSPARPSAQTTSGRIPHLKLARVRGDEQAPVVRPVGPLHAWRAGHRPGRRPDAPTSRPARFGRLPGHRRRKAPRRRTAESSSARAGRRGAHPTCHRSCVAVRRARRPAPAAFDRIGLRHAGDHEAMARSQRFSIAVVGCGGTPTQRWQRSAAAAPRPVRAPGRERSEPRQPGHGDVGRPRRPIRPSDKGHRGEIAAVRRQVAPLRVERAVQPRTSFVRLRGQVPPSDVRPVARTAPEHGDDRRFTGEDAEQAGRRPHCVHSAVSQSLNPSQSLSPRSVMYAGGSASGSCATTIRGGCGPAAA